ncbi:1-phosphofructokinase family hexose kinase [Rathayibacter sp. KR2-224]|uniref:1-phosphofructokinase family hexose kinase n=1 Tax=Rathayibacter sp. KR2-224 TaxID=3400913 RepID=UPI003C0014F9
MIIALALSASLDVTYEVDELHTRDITRPTGVTRVAGGKALNVARAARALGADVHAVAALGGPTGDWVAAMLADDAVEAVVVPLRRVTRTCIAVVESAESATSTDIYEPATELDRGEWDAFAAAVSESVAGALAETGRGGSAPWLALSGSIPPGVPLEQLGQLLAELRLQGARIVVDGSGDGLRATAAAADLIKVNRREASELLGAEQATAADACRQLRARYGCDAVVTDGIAGSAALMAGVEAEVPGATRRGRFPAGSGDSFLGGLLAAFERGESPADALRSASEAGERNALVPGQGRLASE